MTAHRPAPDEEARRAAIHARGVNVLVDAGAGTGKTTILVARLVEMVAPADDRLDAVPLPRVAAITFTRKAAGELKLRIREALLSELAKGRLSATRRERLSAALGALDAAHVGTIHSFADRLLRLSPVEARLSPSYQIVEDAAGLLAETFMVVLHAAEAGTLPAELAGTSAEAVAAEAQAALADAVFVGLRAESKAHDHGEWPGLDRLFERLVETRDVAPAVPAPRPPDLDRFRDGIEEFRRLAAESRGEGAGSRFIAATERRLDALRGEEDPAKVLRRLLWIARSIPKLGKRADFRHDEGGWRAWKALTGDKGRRPVRATPLLDDLLHPFSGWMARRLVRTAPAIVAVYGKVKARHRAVDQLDLLLQLRNLLRDRPDVRARYQTLFDHVLVDEFQDTDPLQAEIVLFLCEDGARAASWRDVALAPGKLTVVGDPKQSIYRFRRADIEVYAAVRAAVQRGRHLVAKLAANFRSDPGLVAWLNDRFDDLLGRVEDGAPVFDPAQGTVANEPLVAGRAGNVEARVQLMPLVAQARKGDTRASEARALSAWLRWLVEGRRKTLVDPATGERRPVRYGDVAILVPSTLELPVLFPELDRLSIPYAARGGSLFLSDPVHRQFLLALRAVADRDDGVAQAALLRPPFFAVDPDDLARERAAPDGSMHPGVLRARAALELVRELRRRRLERAPGATARDLLERTAFARHVALGPNGAQRLDALRELCLALDAVAAAEGLDFDEASARLREWAVAPVPLDPPRPVGDEAVQVLTTFQAKGLEFPVVALWDACADLEARGAASVFTIDRDGGAWSFDLGGLRWDEPEGADVSGREQRYRDAERKRLVYVAATRARDLLLVPVAGDPNPEWITGRLAAAGPAELVETLDPWEDGAEPAWAAQVPPPVAPARGDASALASGLDRAWRAAIADAARPRFAPTSVTSEAHRADDARDEAGVRPSRASRFGNVFGATVHRAIGLALADATLSPGAAAERAARATGLADHRAEAADDVRRALGALERAGLRRPPGPDLRLEYPVALAEQGRLVGGYVDLLAVHEGRLAVVDFKTDAPPAGDAAATHPAYVAQVRDYARILEALGLAAAGQVRAGLLFTAEDEIRWVA